ncbi:MAG: hypothetical protein AABZ57_03870, partial [Candidatus Margulisiibacteriota bacterium]
RFLNGGRPLSERIDALKILAKSKDHTAKKVLLRSVDLYPATNRFFIEDARIQKAVIDELGNNADAEALGISEKFFWKRKDMSFWPHIADAIGKIAIAYSNSKVKTRDMHGDVRIASEYAVDLLIEYSRYNSPLATSAIPWLGKIGNEECKKALLDIIKDAGLPRLFGGDHMNKEAAAKALENAKRISHRRIIIEKEKTNGD